MDKGIHNLVVLVMDKEDYKVRYCAKFTKTTRTAVYNKEISSNATNMVRERVEAVHTAKIADN